MPQRLARASYFLSAVLGAAALTAGCGPKRPSQTGPNAPAQQASTIPVQFSDYTEQSGIKFTHNNGADGLFLMPEIMGGGAAWLDYDGDGDQDLFLVNSRSWTDAEIASYRNGPGKEHPELFQNRPARRASMSSLYSNEGDGKFKDVTAQAGLVLSSYGQGAAVGDYDNDGKTDLFVTSLDRNFLYHNEGGGKFREISQQAGVKSSGWSTSAAWVDFDKDGKLDIFVCRYVKWAPGGDIFCRSAGKDKDYCTPDSYPGEFCLLYHNEGGGKFKDVSAAAGITATKSTPPRRLQGKALGVATTDFNEDGWPDIVVANDTEPNYLFENLQGKGFQEVGSEVGIAYNEMGQAKAAMGVDCADVSKSGRDTLIFGNFSNQQLSLFENQGNRLYIDMAAPCGVGQPSMNYLAFGTVFTDFDNDGWLDIFVANGHVVKRIEETQRDVKFRERPLLFRSKGRQPKGDVAFDEIGEKSGASRPVVGRGVAAADFDMDGDVDIMLTANGERATLYRNENGSKLGAIRLTLEGTKSNRSGIGAVVEVTVGGQKQRYAVKSGSSYCSQSELPVTAGLGMVGKAGTVTIRWPSGAVTELKDIAAGQSLLVNEDQGIVKQGKIGAR